MVKHCKILPQHKLPSQHSVLKFMGFSLTVHNHPLKNLIIFHTKKLRNKFSLYFVFKCILVFEESGRHAEGYSLTCRPIIF